MKAIKKPKIANLIRIHNSSFKLLVLQSKKRKNADDFCYAVQPKTFEQEPGYFLIIDLEPLQRTVDLDECIFLWGNKRIPIEKIEEETEGQCTIFYQFFESENNKGIKQ